MVVMKRPFFLCCIFVIQRLSDCEAEMSIDRDYSVLKHHDGSERNEGKRSERTIRSLNETTVGVSTTTVSNDSSIINNGTISTPAPPFIRTITLPPPITFNLPPPEPPVTPSADLEVYCHREPESCTSKCTNTTSLIPYSFFVSTKRPLCNCDPACNNIFMDCCGDFAERCGKPEQNTNDIISRHKPSWQCERNLDIMLPDGCETVAGAWMISRCPSSWQNDNVKQKCHEATSNIDSKSYDRFIPVVGASDQLTYRNQYCAKCNNVSKFQFWNLLFKKEVILPPFYTVEELRRFLTNNAQHLEGVQPLNGQLMRWCYFPNVTSDCSSKSHPSLNECVNGTVGLVEEGFSVYKNKACASCNGGVAVCNVGKEPNHCSADPYAISRIISLRDYSATEEMTCPKNQVYDPYLEKCRQSYDWSNLVSGSSDKYQVDVTVAKIVQIEHYDVDVFIKEISLYLKMNESQIINIKYFTVKPEEYLITFILCLTPSQSLTVASDPDFLGTSNETIGLRRLFKFDKAFALPITRRILYKLQVRQVTCTRPRTYTFGDYVILNDLRLRVNSTGSVYKQNEYFINTTELKPNVSVCVKLFPPTCNGSFIKLNKSEYQLTSNLSLTYHSRWYNVGEYVLNNASVFICAPYSRNYTVSSEKQDSLALVVLTWIGFIISIVCLVALLLTYLVFPELRTLPGKNIMNICISLCLAEILWLCASSVDANEVACTVIAIANHYFFLVFFTASSVVAFHSSLVFGKKISLRRSKSEENKMFVIYSAITWGVPAVFVACFSLLDHYEIFDVNYGEDGLCWLGTKQSKVFLFILPFGILILLNFMLFVFVAVSLRRNQKSSAKSLEKVARKRQKQNVLACVKLSTLMGFSWFFGLLQVAVETKTDVFAYLFVLFVSFQGVFIALAFLWKRSNYRLYSSLISRSKTTRSTNTSRPSGQQVTQL